MPHPDSKAQLEALRQQQIALARKIKEAEAEAKKKEREKDERRKLLAGAAALAELAVHPDSPFAVTLVSLLNNGLTKAPDRALFSLPPLPKDAKAEAAPDELAHGKQPVPHEPAPSAPAAAPVPKPPELDDSVKEHFERLLGRSNLA
jgi:hypothetical protein